MNNLPKSWAVQGYCSEVLKYLHDNYQLFFDPNYIDADCYLGVHNGESFCTSILNKECDLLSYQQFIGMTKEEQKLTEENITQFGFEIRYVNTFESISSTFQNFILPENRFGVSLCLETNNGFIAGSWYYGSDNIKIDTIEELKMLYKLVTKKDLT